MKVPAGKQLVLGLHLLNTGPSPMSGRSGVQVTNADPAVVTEQAEVIAASVANLSIPPGTVTQSGTCTMTGDVSIFAVLGHMHMTGVHMTTTAGPPDGGTTTLLDEDYQFGNQRYETLDPPVALKDGDQMRMECKYDNPGPGTLTFGESTTQNEMCITFAYRYPALAAQAAAQAPMSSGSRGDCVR